jgi:hypothetical protein
MACLVQCMLCGATGTTVCLLVPGIGLMAILTFPVPFNMNPMNAITNDCVDYNSLHAGVIGCLPEYDLPSVLCTLTVHLIRYYPFAPHGSFNRTLL